MSDIPVEMMAVVFVCFDSFSRRIGLFASPDPILMKGIFKVSMTTSTDTGSMADAIIAIPTPLANS